MTFLVATTVVIAIGAVPNLADRTIAHRRAQALAAVQGAHAARALAATAEQQAPVAVASR